MLEAQSYIKDGAAIYARSFAIIRREADLSRFAGEEESVAVRIIHACGMVEITRDIAFSPTFASAGIQALIAGAPILCDAKMVANGVTHSRLPANNEVICTLDDPSVPVLAAKLGTTCSSVKCGGHWYSVSCSPNPLFTNVASNCW